VQRTYGSMHPESSRQSRRQQRIPQRMQAAGAGSRKVLAELYSSKSSVISSAAWQCGVAKPEAQWRICA